MAYVFWTRTALADLCAMNWRSTYPSMQRSYSTPWDTGRLSMTTLRQDDPPGHATIPTASIGTSGFERSQLHVTKLNSESLSYRDPFGLCGHKGDAPCQNVFVLSVGVAGTYFAGGNATVGVAFSGDGFRLFESSGASFGMGLSLTKFQGSWQRGTLADYGNRGGGVAFSGAGSPNVSAVGSLSEIRESTTDADGQPTTEATGVAAGVGPGFGVFWNYTDQRKATAVIPLATAPRPESYTCAKTGVGCSTSGGGSH